MYFPISVDFFNNTIIFTHEKRRALADVRILISIRQEARYYRTPFRHCGVQTIHLIYLWVHIRVKRYLYSRAERRRYLGSRLKYKSLSFIAVWTVDLHMSNSTNPIGL